MAGNSWLEFEIKGLDELQRKLESLPENVANKGLRDSLKAGALIVLSSFVAFAPKATGFLAEHFDIHLSMRGDDLAGSAYVGPNGKMDYPDSDGGYRTKVDRRGRKHKVGRIAVASVARFLEFNTKKMSGHAFMTPAWESHKETVLDAIIEKLRKALDESAAG